MSVSPRGSVTRSTGIISLQQYAPIIYANKIIILIMHSSSSPILEYTWVDVLTSYEHQFCGDGGDGGGRKEVIPDTL